MLHEIHLTVLVRPAFHFFIKSYSQIKGRPIPKYCIFVFSNISFKLSTFLAPAVTITGIFKISANLVAIGSYKGEFTFCLIQERPLI